MKRVVVVEDNASIAKYFRYVVEHGGTYTVTLTESGDEAVRLAREPDTVAVIVDVSLRTTQYAGRYIDGVELSRILKEDHLAGHASVIIATAHAMAGDRERFLQDSKADAFVRKPITDPKELMAILDRLASPGSE